MPFARRPGQPPRLLGVVHLPALPGSPLGNAPLAEVLNHAVADATALMQGGADGLIVENLGDRPYAAETVDPWTVAHMTRIATALRDVVGDGALGINILRNDPIAALSVASAVDADFIRVNVHTGAMVTDQGVITGRARETIALKRQLGSRARIAADIAVKHASPLGELDLPQTARDTFLRACADALIITGSGTGQPIDVARIDTVRAAVPDAPLWAGSGVTPDTLPALASRCDTLIVGTWLHCDAKLDAPVDVERVRELKQRINAA